MNNATTQDKEMPTLLWTENKEMTFTTLRELKTFIDGLSNIELDACLNMHDWYVIDAAYSRGQYYFSIEGHNGGEE